MSAVLNAINYKQMSGLDIFFIVVLGGGIFMIMAFLADMLMQRLSFGIVGNALLMLIGAVLGLAALVHLGMPPTRRDWMVALLVCGVSSVSVLITLAALKRAA